ncbi:unnamed protein product [Allacma fusca]|uniref:DUF4781 domain-containing protein n=1 Tax=Allacma fusca TaxID=39272 RepID=A0A8J2PEL7_9HEXA|nr:unnamed protein product [Allacma fusca]
MNQSVVFTIPEAQSLNLMDADLINFNPRSQPQYIFPPGSIPPSPAFLPNMTPPGYSPPQTQFVYPPGNILPNFRPECAPGTTTQFIRCGSSRQHLLQSSSESEPSPDIPCSPLNRSGSSAFMPTGTQQAKPFKERLQQMSIIVDQEIESIAQIRTNRDQASCRIVSSFEQLNLNTIHEIKGADITELLKFCLRIPLQHSTPTVTAKQGKQLERLKSALFKECGFAVRVQMIPLLCYTHKTMILNLPRNSNTRNATLVVLLRVWNKNQKEIVVDSDGRVYRNFQDWNKHNTLPPATLFGPLSKGQVLTKLKTPSCQATKIAINAVDIIIGIGAVTAGVACLVSTGGFALIPMSLLAGEIAASVYMGIRGTMSLHDRRRHRPKRR